MSPRYWRRAVAELAERDPVMAGLIDGVTVTRPGLRHRPDPFQALARVAGPLPMPCLKGRIAVCGRPSTLTG